MEYDFSLSTVSMSLIKTTGPHYKMFPGSPEYQSAAAAIIKPAAEDTMLLQITLAVV